MKYFLLAVFSLFCFGSSVGQISVSHLREYSIQVWTTEEGLPSNNLRQVVQDSKGYIWLSSFNGLMRFDGNTFDIFNSDVLPELKSNGFSVISGDLNGNLYYGTLTSGLLKYDGSSFKLFNVENAFSKSITALCGDSKGNIWVGVQSNGLYILNGSSNKIRKVENQLIQNTTVSFIMEASNGDIWIATQNNGIIIYSDGKYSELSGVVSTGVQISCIKEHDGKVFIGSSDGVYINENGNWRIIKNTRGYFVNYLDHDRYGNLWVATETGIIRIMHSGVAEYLTESDGLPSRQISSLVFDTEDNIWLASKRGGLVVLRQSNFTNISQENGLSSPFVNTVYQFAGGVMAIGSDNGDVDLLKHNEILKMPIATNLKDISIKDILQDRQGNKWLATYKGVIKINNQSEQLLTISDGMASNSPRCLFEDNQGNVWIGSKDGGLLKIDPEGLIKTYSIKTGMSDNYVFCIDQLPNGNIIVGTYQGGLNIISSDDKITVLNVGADDSSPLIFNIEIINNSEYWLATDVGLYKFQNETFYIVDKDKGLQVTTIFDIHIDDYGYLWLTSNLGVVRLKRSDIDDFIAQQIPLVNARLYDERDGMLSRECTGATKVFAAPSGNIWIPTSKGISVIDPGNIYINEKVPPVYIKSITVDGEVVNGALESIRLKAGTQRLTINYTALSYYSPAKIDFKYRLKGFEKEWNEVGNKYQATYMNLPDGSFTFEVMAANNDGVWNEIPATIEVGMDPYFYESRLFSLLLVVFILVVAFIIYWIRIRVVETKNRELKKLNDELDSFVYSVSHDLRAPLSSILGLINISKIDNEKENLPSYISKIETSVNKLDAFIKEIISYSRNVRLNVEVEEVDLKLLIDEVLDGLTYLDPKDNIEVIIETSRKTIIHSDKIRLQVILNNIISNAFRYYKSYINDSYIKIKVLVNNAGAVITVEDNGVGIKPDRINRIFEMFYRATDTSNGSGLGLYIAKESVAKLDGTITVESQFERGTTFTVTIGNL